MSDTYAFPSVYRVRESYRGSILRGRTFLRARRQLIIYSTAADLSLYMSIEFPILISK